MSNIEEGQGSGRRGERGLVGIMGASHELRGAGWGTLLVLARVAALYVLGSITHVGREVFFLVGIVGSS